ncbi:MAG: formylglycine-generating enzyme family protein [Elusimicrobiota bacterium]|nr:formylglycine-generating enzyme family protein [Elusimicrobiota bacterium]
MKKLFILIFIVIMVFPLTAQSNQDMVFVKGGTFTMGSPPSERMRGGNEGPQHEVTVSDFYLGKYEVTQKEYLAVMGTNPSAHKGDNLPVESITWYEAIQYCNALSIKEGLTPVYTIRGATVTWNHAFNGYRLPTEAEWEYAAKGGNKDAVTFLYAGSNNADTVGWHSGNSSESRPVGSKAPNGLGLYDMSGNVGEMCWDFHGPYDAAPQTNPAGAPTGVYHVGRGGCWYYDAQYLRASFRAYIEPETRYHMVGFRIALNAE